VEAALQLLRAARQQQPAVRELPRDEDAAEAAGAALHALLVLLTGRALCRWGGGCAAQRKDRRLPACFGYGLHSAVLLSLRC
jgi:hypothetical protein